MEFQDKTIRCRDCGQTFTFSAGEQAFYVEKGLVNEPQRCQTCRANRRRERNGVQTLPATTINCSACGREARVPFVPRFDRPVYCSDCFTAQRSTAAAGA